MYSQNSLCAMLNEQAVRPAVQQQQQQHQGRRGSRRTRLVKDECADDDVVLCGLIGCKGEWNNLALGSLDFKHVPSQLIDLSSKCSPRVGDVCVRLMPIAGKSEEYASIVDLYNTYVAKGSSLIAKTCIHSYAGTEELYIPAIPIHTFVSEWNKSLQQFHDMIRCEDGLGQDETRLAQTRRRSPRLAVVSNVTEMALKNVPIVSDHLWFVLHAVVSKPCLVKHVVQLVGSVASKSGTVYHTSEVENTTVPGADAAHAVKLYLVAKSVPAKGNRLTVLGDEAGATLGLVWVADEAELHECLRNSENCHYVHIGTQAGNTFRCNGVCEWRYFDYVVFDRMTAIGQRIASRFGNTALAGNTGDSARCLNRA